MPQDSSIRWEIVFNVSNCGTGNAQLDWVLHPNQHYVRADGNYVFLTDAIGTFTAYPGAHDMARA